MITDIVATNSLGQIYQFDDVNRVVNGMDLSGLEADVSYLETNLSGSRYQSTKIRNRNFDLEVRISKLFQDETAMDSQRERMYQVFNPELNPIRFDFKTSDGTEYYLTAYATATPRMAPDKSNYNAAYQRALLQFVCTDPYIYQGFSVNVDTRVEISSYIGNIEFDDFEIPEDGREVEYRTPSLSANVFYTGSSEDGMVIKYRATGPVVNPRLLNVVTYEAIKLNITLQTGDIVTISTYKGERGITLLRGGVTTNIFNTFSISDSKFLQIKPGDNVFRFEADSGEEFLEVAIDYRIRKVGI